MPYGICCTSISLLLHHNSLQRTKTELTTMWEVLHAVDYCTSVRLTALPDGVVIAVLYCHLILACRIS